MKQPVLTVIVAAIAVVFAIQNASPTEISFLFWQASVSKALLILVVLLAGMIAGYFLQWPKIARMKKQISELKSVKPS
jgi:uncharacterized integral membrane protein